MLDAKQTVAILESEAAASFHPLSRSQVEAGLTRLGFITVEDTVLAEEIVAEQYLRFCRESGSLPIIRSSCPVVVEFLLKYYPQFMHHLVPVASPKLVQGRLIKTIYPEAVATVCITACPARKFEVRDQSNDGTIDAVLTFGELKALLREARVDLGSFAKDHRRSSRPFLARTVSVAGGFPREIVASRTSMDKQRCHDCTRDQFSKKDDECNLKRRGKSKIG